MMTAEYMLSKRPVLRLTAALFILLMNRIRCNIRVTWGYVAAAK